MKKIGSNFPFIAVVATVGTVERRPRRPTFLDFPFFVRSLSLFFIFNGWFVLHYFFVAVALQCYIDFDFGSRVQKWNVMAKDGV